MPTDTHLHAGMEHLQQERHAVALEHFALAAEEATGEVERRAAVAFAAQVSVVLRRPYEAIAWAERLREEHDASAEADLLEATACIALGDGAYAQDLLASVTEIPSSPFTTYPAGLLPQLRCQAHALAGDDAAAVVEALSALRHDWGLPEVWRCLASLAARGAVDAPDAVACVPEDGLLELLGWLLDAPAAGADAIVEALWHRFPHAPEILALVTTLGNRLALDRAMEWSARLRAAGLSEECAVLGIAADDERPVVERIRAAAIADAAFGDPRAATLAEGAAASLSDDAIAQVLQELLAVGADDVIDGFVIGVATTAWRSRRLADLLAERGAHQQAEALARHADQLAGAATG